jgi:catechol 2,3-dioxygenase
MLQVTRPTPSHFGIFVTDLERMVAFYTDVFDLTVTDRGEGKTFRNTLVFTSASPDQHHQLVLASGRPADATFSTVMQISFAVPGIQYLRDIWAKAAAQGATNIRGLNHGNALSVYMLDPEGNTVEVYVDTPFYVAQPHGDPLDLSKTDEELLRETEAICRSDPTFKPVAQWELEFSAAAPGAQA